MSDEMRADIAAAWAKVTNKMGKKRDIRKLPEYLNGGETVLSMTGGIIAGTTDCSSRPIVERCSSRKE